MKACVNAGCDPRVDWESPEAIEQVRRAVAHCTAYPAGGGAVELVQTQISSVFLTPRHAFKFKRAVDMGFADFRALRQRRHFCREEMRLNGRLGKGVYLDVLPLYEAEGGYRFEPGGRIVDYAVVMKRLERDRMMDYRVTSGELSGEELESVARVLARFHRRARATPALERFGGMEVLTTNWEENFRQAAPYVNITIAEADFHSLQHAVFAYLVRNRTLLEGRVREGHIKDGHGDLRCEHIYLGEEIKIIDCIEFNDRYRIGDVASDLTFLLMDLAALGHPEMSRSLLCTYIALAKDESMVPLVPFYACYRAFVRGKVLSLKLSDRHLSRAEQQSLIARAGSFFALAVEFSRQMSPPVVLAMAGLMGTGKSALADALSRRTGAALLSSDSIRKEQAGGAYADMQHARGRQAAFGEGIYTEDWNARAYSAMFERAAEQLALRRSVILDASFARRDLRDRVFRLAAAHGAEAFLVECTLPDTMILSRLAGRVREGWSVSDGRIEIFPRQKEAFERILEIPRERHVLLRTDRPVQALVDEVLAHRGLEIPAPLFSLKRERTRREKAAAPRHAARHVAMPL